MEFSQIGATDCAISRLGFGCAAASNYDYGPLDEAAWIDAVKAAVDAGINFFTSSSSPRKAASSGTAIAA